MGSSTMDLRSLSPGPAEDRVARDVGRSVEEVLQSLGLLGRVFWRVKDGRSTYAKLRSNDGIYAAGSKRMQDLFGVRVAVYFADDSTIAQEAVRSLYEFDSESVSSPPGDIFGPTRCNLVFRLPESLAEQSSILQQVDLIDATFEAQFRTVLSEGWHEVEHDLRYKRKAEWGGYADLNRALNGVMATLESCDWTMLKIFEELAWRQYKARDFVGMLHSKFRIRITDGDALSAAFVGILDGDAAFVKALFRVDRLAFLRELMRLKGLIPLTAQNILLLSNRFFIHDRQMRDLEPTPVAEILDRSHAGISN